MSPKKSPFSSKIETSWHRLLNWHNFFFPIYDTQNKLNITIDKTRGLVTNH